MTSFPFKHLGVIDSLGITFLGENNEILFCGNRHFETTQK